MFAIIAVFMSNSIAVDKTQNSCLVKNKLKPLLSGPTPIFASAMSPSWNQYRKQKQLCVKYLGNLGRKYKTNIIFNTHLVISSCILLWRLNHFRKTNNV